jgi:RNA polymerase sigma-70 factor, ECF subfamily
MSGPTSHHGHPSYKRTPGTPGLNRTTGNEDTVEEKDVVKFHNGETTSFSQLVREHHRALTALARTLVTDGDAEEVVQNAWLKAYRAIDDFEGRSSVRTWLSRIVINEARMKLRQHWREVTLDEELGPDSLRDRFDSAGNWRHPPSTWSADSPEALLMREDMARCLAKTLASMPPYQRALIELRDVQQLPFDDICNMLGISASNARVLLHRARTQIFAVVDRYQETGEC